MTTKEKVLEILSEEAGSVLTLAQGRRITSKISEEFDISLVEAREAFFLEEGFNELEDEARNLRHQKAELCTLVEKLYKIVIKKVDLVYAENRDEFRQKYNVSPVEDDEE